MAVEMQYVSSSAISAIGYDAEEKEMHVQFKSGGLHIYEEVKQATFDALVNADSVGSYFHKHIRDKFDSRQA